MAKKLRSIIITLCVGAVALSTYFIADAVMANRGTDKTTTTVLTSYSASEIASLKVTLQDGDYYFITENAAESTSSYIVPYKVTFNGVFEGVEYDSSRANSLMSAACNLSASRDLGKMDESEFALFGVDKPQSVITITKTNGTQFNIYVGSQSTATGSYYCRVDGSDHVYVIDATKGALFVSKVNDMRLKEILPITDVDKIKAITWTDSNGEKVHVYQELEYSVYNPFTKFFVDSPWKKPMPVNAEEFSNFIKGWSAITIRDYITPKINIEDIKLADYGFDKPWGYYKIETTDGDVQEISIGKFSDELNYNFYVWDHSTDNIYIASQRDKMEFLQSYNCIKVTTRYILNAKVDDIASLEIKTGGNTYLMEIKKIRNSQENNENDSDVSYTYEYRLNGLTYKEKALPMLYQAACGIRVQHQNKDYGNDDEVIVELTFTPRDSDEAVRNMQFKRYNDTFCAVYENGVSDILVSMDSVKALQRAVEVVLAGGVPEYSI